MALPIQGESFLLRRSGKNVLIDGGYKKDKIADVLNGQFSDVSYLSVVVCTHGDNDHVGGVADLLEKWGERVGQLWLPGRWVDVVPDLVCDPAKFFKQLISELDAELRQSSDAILSIIQNTTVEALRGDVQKDRGNSPYADNIQPVDEWVNDPDLPFDTTDVGYEPEWFAEIRRSRVDSVNTEGASSAYKSARRKVRYRLKKITSEYQARIACYWLGLIETAEAIRKVANAAIEQKIPTRWFDFEGFQKTRQANGGARGFLVPVNSVEQASSPKNIAIYLRLTEINRESLVFLAPPARERLGVLFCADSPLGDGSDFGVSFLSSLRMPRTWFPIVATAPHHGSESNNSAYSHLHDWANIATLLRAGGSKKQPGATFLSQHTCLRLCTKCPKADHPPLLSGVFLSRPYHNRCHPGISSHLIAFGRRCVC